MVTVISDKRQIQKLHHQFHDTLNKYFTEKIYCRVGYPGGSFEDDVYYSKDLDLWIGATKLENRYWNGFGHGRPIDWNSNSISGEINFSIDGINRRIAGAFAEEDNGNILVLHRGKIGGGKVGIGKAYFTDNCRCDFVTAIDGDKESEFCLVGELNSKHFPKQVANFIGEILRVKHLDDGETAANFDLSDFNYTDEHSGQTVTERNDPIIIERTHGIVVNALAQELRNRELKIGNDRNRDLFIHNRGQITTLFEIKTSSSTQCLYSAVGQLLLYSIPIGTKVNLVAVLPDELSKTVSKRFHSLGINLLYYEWKNDEPKFTNIDDLL
jgi:hypothetical protein